MKNWTSIEKILVFVVIATFSMGAYKAYTVISSTPNVRVEYVSYGGSGEPSACTADPCTIYRKSAGVTGVTKGATAGQVKIVFPAGTFSEIPECTGTSDNAVGGNLVVRDRAYANSATEVGLRTLSDAGSSTNGMADVICIGAR